MCGLFTKIHLFKITSQINSAKLPKVSDLNADMKRYTGVIRIGRRLMLASYDVLMNDKYNPLRKLPPAQRFQLMVWLSVMWTTLFCLMIGGWVYFGELLIFHLLFMLGFSVTGLIFSKQSVNSHLIRI